MKSNRLSGATKKAAIGELLSSGDTWAQAGHQVSKLQVPETCQAEIEGIQLLKKASEATFREVATRLRSLGAAALTEAQSELFSATETARCSAGGHPDQDGKVWYDGMSAGEKPKDE